MIFWLLQQGYTYISTKLRCLFMNSLDVDFLYNVNESHGPYVLAYTPITHDWVDDVITRPIIEQKNGAFVETVQFCKCKGLPAKHEFLLCALKEADPKDPRRPRETIVLIERNNMGSKDDTGAETVTPNDVHGTAVNGRIDVGEDPGNGSEPGSMAQEIPSGNPQAVRSVSETDMDGSYSGSPLDFLHGSSSSSPSFRKRKSGDYMVFSRNGTDSFVKSREGRFDVGRMLTLPPKTFTLLQLTTLFCVVHHKKPDYRLPYYNCHWYSGAIYKSINELVEGCTEKVVDPKVKIGSTVGLLPPLPGDVTLEEFVQGYKTQWERTQENIKAVREHGTEPIRDAQEAQKEAERAQAEEKIRRLEGDEKIKRLEAEFKRFREHSKGNQSTAAPATVQRSS